MARVSGVLSVRTECEGGDVATETEINPTFWLDGTTHLVLLIHGFNNDVNEARESFRTMTELLPDRFPKIGWVYWPGDADLGWFDFLDFVSYPTEIIDAQGSAELLAGTLRQFNKLNPGAEVTLVGHSLGCRLISECLDIMMRQSDSERPSIHAVVFLAAAVPVDLAESGEDLGDALRSLVPEGYVFYSEDDIVLHYAFPAGQTLAAAMGYENEIYLEPVGRHGNPRDVFPQAPVNCSGNGHGSYWNDPKVIWQIADLGGAVLPRATESRSTPADHQTPSWDLPRWSHGNCWLF